MVGAWCTGGQATWLTVDGGHVSAWVHAPSEGKVKGAVVMAPAVARESVISFRAWRVLAVLMARAGYLVVRFNFRGDADSTALVDDDAVSQWKQDFLAAMDLATTLAPGAPVSAIGLRVGAAVVSDIDDERLAVRLLWEPVEGKRFLREHEVLRRLSVPLPSAPKDEGAELAGSFFTPAQVEGLKKLSTRRPAGSTPVAIRLEADRGVAARLYAVETRESEVPRSALQALIGQLEVGPDDVALREWHPLQSAESSIDGVRILETHVQVGEHQLPGVQTRPVEADPCVGVVYTAAGAEQKDGPSGLWAQSARSASAAGAVTLRTDRRNLGDLLDVSQDVDPMPYMLTGIEDTVVTVRALQDDFGVPVVAVGLCIGGWLFARASESLQGERSLDRIVAVNNVAWQRDIAFWRRLYRGPWIKQFLSPAASHDTPAGAGQEVAPDSIDWKRRLMGALKKIREVIETRSPTPVWRLAAKLNLAQEPTDLIRRIPSRTVLELHYGVEDSPRWVQARGPQVLPGLVRRGHLVTVREHDSLDHGLLAQESRHRVMELVSNLVATYAAQDQSAQKV